MSKRGKGLRKRSFWAVRSRINVGYEAPGPKPTSRSGEAPDRARRPITLSRNAAEFDRAMLGTK